VTNTEILSSIEKQLTRVATILDNTECVARSEAGDACGACTPCRVLGAAVMLEHDLRVLQLEFTLLERVERIP